MATLLGTARTGNVTIRATKTGPVLEETWSFTVQADSVNESRVDVTASIGLIPGLYVVDGYAVLRSLSGTFRQSNPLIWDFIGEFSSEVEDGGDSGGDPSSDPVEWTPVYSTKFAKVSRTVDKDTSGDAIANSAGQPFETGIIQERLLPVWEFYQFEPASTTDEQVIARSNTVNSTTFRGRAAKSLKCDVLSSDLGFYYGQRRRLTQYRLTYDLELWTHKRQDTGTVYLDSSVQKPYLDDDGNVMLGGLDGSGAKVTAGDPPAVLEFDIFQSVDFHTFLRT